jgi:UDP-glucose 4-epimerase
VPAQTKETHDHRLPPAFAPIGFEGGSSLRAVVTGGAGFIGSNLVRFLLHEGHEVVILDNLVSGYRQNLEAEAEFIEGDIRSQELLDHCLAGTDVVYHLAASVGNKRSIDNPLEDADVNVMGTLKLLQTARAHGIKKVVFSSSAGIFGELKSLPIREDHPIEPDSPYGASKLCAEKQCLAFSKLFEMECVCLRYFNVFGPRQRFDAYGNVIPIFVFQMLRGEKLTIFGDGEQTRDFVNVADVVQANYKSSVKAGTWGAFNLGSGNRISINRLVELLGELNGKAPVVEYGPKRPGDVRDSLADISKARDEFGFEPSIDLVDGLREYLDWARSEVASR